MISRLENKIIIYVSILLGTVLNIHKLLVLVPHKKLISFWVFNLPELVFQSFTNILFCLLIGFINLKILKTKDKRRKNLFLWVGNIVITVVCTLILFKIQELIFDNVKLLLVSFGGNLLRFGFSTLSMIILVRFLILLEANEMKEKENKKLQEAYLNAEINNLKGQINPHFLFNSLSNLSALVREDTNKAQLFIANLSKVFRYSLNTQNVFSTTLEEELKVLKAYAQLQEIRLENSLKISIEIPFGYLKYTLPVISLQPLLENAIKHNHASESSPLVVIIYVEDDCVVVENNLQKNNIIENSTGNGLANLAERYRLLYKEEITIVEGDEFFKVALPLELV
ncbi:hypothetical protein NBRC110019_06460 [Neptunitalea chrysea]|uniref:Signal transduction histidine kinase internal region domain-containing protein n=1 Tax=Neptunitalea chrysea TaxID=1647581 RepID=A0A9W6EUQ2_9FLAO|nr:histidine kinase [Neptunitalea chrysea]GLB51607.1 hypothetical protein NBRC110019_06460 [Neptunitalea chrysea]